jgi:GAF domain-containing protein
MYSIQQNGQYESRLEFYQNLLLQAKALIEGEQDKIANLSNIAALLFMLMDQINWVGFYLMKENELVLGPFQGKPACIRIALGKGVCGTAASTGKSQCVKDVHTFPGHIACDPDSNSEIVIPLKDGDKILGVLDIDSPIINRFDEEDQKNLETLTDLLVNQCTWN